MKRVLSRGVAAIAVGLALVGCSLRPTHTYRYRMTVEIETPQGLRVGSAVRQVRWRAGTQVTPEADTAFMTHKGEAVVVALPRGEYLFALPSPDGEETPKLGFGSAALKPPYDDDIKVMVPPEREEKVYGKSGFPRLVRFGALDDPKSIHAVDPRNLESTYGPGYRLKSVTVQLTTDDTTSNVRTILPWIDQFFGTSFIGSRTEKLQDIEEYGLPAQIGAGSFIQGDRH